MRVRLLPSGHGAPYNRLYGSEIGGGFSPPEILAELFALTARHHRTTTEAWQGLMEFLVGLDEDPEGWYTCPDLRKLMTTQGMWPSV